MAVPAAAVGQGAPRPAVVLKAVVAPPILFHQRERKSGAIADRPPTRLGVAVEVKVTPAHTGGRGVEAGISSGEIVEMGVGKKRGIDIAVVLGIGEVGTGTGAEAKVMLSVSVAVGAKKDVEVLKDVGVVVEVE